VGAGLQTLTICVSPNAPLGRKVSDEFTVPLCRAIIARPIALAMKPHGGKMLALIQPSARALWLETHPLPTIAPTEDINRPSGHPFALVTNGLNYAPDKLSG
jgi:hypothetical protein